MNDSNIALLLSLLLNHCLPYISASQTPDEPHASLLQRLLNDSNSARLLSLHLKRCLRWQFTSYFAIRAESTIDMNLVSSESVREVSTTGALVPMTMAASSALASWASVL